MLSPNTIDLHLAELNIGKILYPLDHPAMADFVNNLDRINHLFQFAYRTEHTSFFKRKPEWFHRPTEVNMVLWWIPAGHQPTIAEAEERLTHLRQNGETPFAFSFKNRFTPAEASTFSLP